MRERGKMIHIFFRLDNFTADNLPNRLRDGSASSTGLDSAGGGAFIFDGAAAGSTETLGRLQMALDGARKCPACGAEHYLITSFSPD
jgi:hypothetical protein